MFYSVRFAILLVVCSTTSLFGQDNEIAVPASKISPGHYLNDETYDLLGFSDLQKDMANNVRNIYGEWQFQSVAIRRKPGFQAIREEKYLQMYDMATIPLSEQQKKGLDQVIILKYYAIKARELMPAGFEDAGFTDHPLGLLLHPTIQQAIGVDSGQTDGLRREILEIIVGVSDKRAQVDKSCEKLFADWQNDLLTNMRASDRTLYREQLGDPINFDGQFKQLFQFAYSAGPLCVKSTNKFSYRGFVPGQNPFFQLGQLNCQFNTEFEPFSIYSVILMPNISAELNLTASEINRVKELRRTWMDANPLGETVEIGNTFGLSDHNKADQLYEKYKKNAKGQLEAVLGETKLRRLRQIWNQIIIQFGWREVPLAHPDWLRALELPKMTHENFSRVHEKYRKQYLELKAKAEKEIKAETAKRAKEIFASLGQEKLRRLEKLVGAIDMLKFE